MAHISIIVPIFKSEDTLHLCINSILDQSFTDIEVILIDDGSPDNCGKECDEYAQNDPRIKVIHQENQGVAAARNTGLRYATGEYITFVDSDDWIEPQMYESMVRTAEKYNCDVVMCDCIKEFRDHKELYSHDIRGGFYCYDQLKNEYYPHLLIMENTEYPATISNWLCVFRRSLLESNNQKKDSFLFPNENIELQYLEGVRNCEDLLFGAEMMYRAKSFYYMKGQAFYHYMCESQNSASRRLPLDIWNDFLILHEAAEREFLNCQTYDFRHQMDLLLLSLLYTAIKNICNTKNMDYKERKSRIHHILNEKKVREMFKRISVLKLPISWKLKGYTLIYKYRYGLDFVLQRN